VTGAQSPDDSADPGWPLRQRDRTDGIEWTLAVRLAIDNPDGEKLPDQFWWETDDVTAGEFVLVAGYARFSPLDWAGQVGVRRYRDLEDDLEALMNQLARGDDLQTIDDRAARERPWLTIGRFLEEARDVRLDRPGLEDLQVKTRDAALARGLIDDRAASALLTCTQLVRTPESFLRIWMGAPNLRFHFAVPIAGEAQRAQVVQDVVELGVAIARSAGTMMGANL
jgi:hypothetical protein